MYIDSDNLFMIGFAFAGAIAFILMQHYWIKDIKNELWALRDKYNELLKK